MRLLPPIWFVGLYQTGIGWSQPRFRELAAWARTALGLVSLVAAATYALSYRRSVARSFEEFGGPAAAPRPIGRVLTGLANRVLARNPAERALFHFVRQTLTRSRSHRVLVASYAGVGFALVFQSVVGVMASGNRTWWQNPTGPLLPGSLVLSLLLLAGLRHAFTVPAELRANWIFQLADGNKASEFLVGARKAVVSVAILPLFGVLLVIHGAIWGWRAAASHSFYGFVVTCLLMDVLLAGFDKLPFTCSYVPGKANLRARWPLYLGGYLTYVSVFSGIEYLILLQPSRMFWFLGAAALTKLGLEVHRRGELAGDFALLFDERPELTVRDLELQQ